MIDQELLNRGPVISTSLVRRALLSQHHVKLYEMGDAIEAFVQLESSDSLGRHPRTASRIREWFY